MKPFIFNKIRPFLSSTEKGMCPIILWYRRRESICYGLDGIYFPTKSFHYWTRIGKENRNFNVNVSSIF